MSPAKLTDADIARAEQIWMDYQQHNDVSDQRGQVVGIDPSSGRIWFGQSALDIRRQMDVEGVPALFYCMRVGQDHYLRKGGRR